MTLVGLLSLAFVLGARHALEPDHLVAVSTLAVEERRPWHVLRLSLSSGIGHLLPLCLVGIPVLLLGLRLPEWLASLVDLGVAGLLVLLGLRAIWRLRYPVQAHAHHHTHVARSRLQSLCVGMAHGLAGSGPAVLLTLTVTASPTAGLFYLAAFGAGTCLGMLLATGVVALPALVAARRWRPLQVVLQSGAGVASILIGLSFGLANLSHLVQ